MPTKRELESALEITNFANESLQASLDRTLETLKGDRELIDIIKAKLEAATLIADRVPDLERQIADKQKNYDYYYKAHSDLSKVNDQVHDVLDAVGCPVPRKSEVSYTEMPVTVRVAAMMTILPRLPQPEES